MELLFIKNCFVVFSGLNLAPFTALCAADLLQFRFDRTFYYSSTTLYSRDEEGSIPGTAESSLPQSALGFSLTGGTGFPNY